MKLAKKVLSVVLALAIALGAFAVAASANGNPDTAKYQAKIWLTGSVGTVKWTTNAAVKLTEGEESEPGATIEAQPGDTIFVRLYATNNYYVGLFQTNLFYSADLIDAAEDYQAQRGKAITAAYLKKVHIWNTAHLWVEQSGTGYSAQNAWTLQGEDAKYNVAENWPTDDAGNNLFNTADWKWNRIMNLANENVSGETCIWEDDSTHLIMMPVKIPADAEPGSTYYVTIPEGLEQRSAKKGGSTRLTEIGICDGESEPGPYVDTIAQTQYNMQYADDNQYFDYSEATLTIQIPGASEPEVDYTALEKALADAAIVLAGNITADSKAALNAAITAGNSALSSEDQATVDAAVEALTAAIAAAKNLADFTALNKALSDYAALNKADWTDASWAAVAAAYATAAAIDQTNEADQAKVNAAANSLAAAIADLVPALDYSALAAKVAEVAGTDTSIYTDATAGAFNAALATAQSLVANENAADQAEINNALAALTNAFAALAEKDADYSALDVQIGSFELVNPKNWTADSYAAAKAKYDEAKAVARDLKISDQAIIDAAANALDAAIKALVPAGAANYDALNAAIAEAKALVADNYVDFSGVAAALATAENVDKNLTANDQDVIDAATAALVNAMGALVEADADYSKVTAATAAANAILNKKDDGVNSYSDDTLAAINAALATVETGLKKKDQAKVDAMAAAINAAISTAEFRAWDYSAIRAKIAEIEANAVDYYDADEYAAYLAAKNALVWDYTYEQYGLAMFQQNNFLKITVAAAAAADYSAVNDAIDAFEAKIAAAEYEQDGIDAVNAIIDTIDWNLNENKQDVVDKYAADIIAATAALVEIVVEPADYDALDKAIAAAEALEADDYVAFADVAAALAAANNVARDLTIDDQAKVDAAADALNEAMAALELKADYTALDAAIRTAGTYDKNAWTADTWAAVDAALAEAAEIDRNLGVSAQDTIDAAAAAITDALGKLVAKEVVSSISTITYTPAEDTHNTFDVVVNGRMAMVQFIEEDGGTRTYDRYNKNVTIVSYNAAGEVVNSLSRDVAYEIWTINTNLIGPNVEVRTKYLVGNQYIWETERYSFELQFVEPTFDADIREITPVATSGKKGAVSTTVVVGPDAQAIRFVMANGTTTTYSADKATVLDNGDLQFVGNAWANDAGVNTIIVKVKVNGAWVEMSSFDYTVE
ncbi:MAG: hypothetical protein IIU80_08205 [Clostridia bacterium]|nr:hypothetical protein [Clostridia bacterium]